jgi:ATP-binding cassette subfamily B protein
MTQEKPKNIQYARILWYFRQQLKRHPLRVTAIILLIAVGNLAGAFAPFYLKSLIDLMARAPSEALILPAMTILFLYIGFRAANLVAVRTSFWNLAIIDARIMSDLRYFAFSRLIERGHSFFTNNFTGSLTQKISKFYKAFETVWDILVMQIIPLFLWIATALYMISRYSAKIAGVFALGIVVYFVFNYFFIKYKAKYDHEASEADTKTVAGISDSLSNHLTIQLFTGTSHEEAHVGGLIEEHRGKKLAQWKRHEVMFTAQAVLFTALEFFILRYSISEWQAGLLSAGTIVLFQVYIIGVVNRLFDFSQVFRRLSEAFSDAQEMVAIMDQPLEVTDTLATETMPPVRGSIEFKDASFAYHEGNNLIEGFSLSIQPGEKVALVGVSGAGKSTLFKLLLRLYDRTGGELLIDEKPIESYTQDAARAGIAFVPQEPVLFHRSLLENIRYGQRDADIESVKAAARDAECLDFIENLPHGFETLVGERGVKLSGGERQRVAIARAILKNAPILLLDEATSSLDSHSELEIQKALEHLMKDKTVIAIAHRLSTIKKMDRIIVLKQGAIIEEGTHDSLLAKKDGAYRKLWELQVGGFITDTA